MLKIGNKIQKNLHWSTITYGHFGTTDFIRFRKILLRVQCT